MNKKEWFLAKSNARPCKALRKFTGVTIHETGNQRNGAGAKSHATYMNVNGGNNQYRSAHYYVDDKEIYQCIPENEVSWHAGDGYNGKGNNETISIEICQNPESNFDIAFSNACILSAEILHRKGVKTAKGNLYQHNDWTRKNCPEFIRTRGLWNKFITDTQKQLDVLCGVTKPVAIAPKPLKLTLDHTPLYATAYSSEPSSRITGTFYLYDGILTKGKYRITNRADRVGKLPIGANVTGWINSGNVK